MSFHETDEEIIELFKNGNQEVFKDLVDKYTSHLYNFTARLVGRGNADDIVQEIFIKVWKSIKHFNPQKASFKTWIFTIAKNTTTDFLRKKKHLNFSDLQNHDGDSVFIDNIPDENLLPDKILQKLENTALLNDALSKLRIHYREVLVLHYQEEMTFDEIGKVLGKPLNTVKSEHRRALIELRKMFE